jgi:hypothetical protein
MCGLLDVYGVFMKNIFNILCIIGMAMIIIISISSCELLGSDGELVIQNNLDETIWVNISRSGIINIQPSITEIAPNTSEKWIAMENNEIIEWIWYTENEHKSNNGSNKLAKGKVITVKVE